MVFALITVSSLLQGVLYLLVGRAVGQRDLTGPERVANVLFATWWYSLAAITLARGLLEVLHGFLAPDLALQVTYTYLFAFVLVVAMWALSGYLGFLFTGRRAWIGLAALYAPLVPALFYLIAYANPIAVQAGHWQVELVYERDPAFMPLAQFLLVVLFVPPILGALAYLALVARAPTRVLKARVVFVASSLVVWLGSSVLASVLGWNEHDAWILIGRLIGLAAAATILFAYRMPAWFRRAMGEG